MTPEGNPLHLPLLRRGLRRDHRIAGRRRSPACAATRTTRRTSGGCAPRARPCTSRPAGRHAPDPAAAADAARAARRAAPRRRVGRGAGPGQRAVRPHHPGARPRRRGFLHQRPVADRGLLRLQQAGQGPDRHQQHRQQLAPVHEQRGGRLQAHAGRRRAAGLLRRREPRAVPVHRRQQHRVRAPGAVSPHRGRQAGQPGAEDHRRRPAPHRHRRHGRPATCPCSPAPT